MDIDLIDLLNPYSLLVGVTTVVDALRCTARIFLTMKTEGELLDRVKRRDPAADGRLLRAHDRVLIAWTLLLDQPDHRQLPRPALDRRSSRCSPSSRRSSAWRFARAGSATSAPSSRRRTMIALLMGTVAAGLYPVMLPSSIDPAYDLTITNAASAEQHAAR